MGALCVDTAVCGAPVLLGKPEDSPSQMVVWEASSITIVCVELELFGTVDASRSAVLCELPEETALCTADELGDEEVGPGGRTVGWELLGDTPAGMAVSLLSKVVDCCVRRIVW